MTSPGGRVVWARRPLTLCAIAVATYANWFTVGFVYDSRQLILEDPRVHAATAENVDLILHRSY